MKVENSRGQPAQPDVAVRPLRAADVANQQPEAAAVDEIDRAQMQHQVRPIDEQVVEHLLQGDRLGSFDDPAGTGHDGDVADATVFKGERHGGIVVGLSAGS